MTDPGLVTRLDEWKRNGGAWEVAAMAALIGDLILALDAAQAPTVSGERRRLDAAVRLSRQDGRGGAR